VQRLLTGATGPFPANPTGQSSSLFKRQILRAMTAAAPVAADITDQTVEPISRPPKAIIESRPAANACVGEQGVRTIHA
jgi:hypothetical protein